MAAVASSSDEQSESFDFPVASYGDAGSGQPGCSQSIGTTAAAASSSNESVASGAEASSGDTSSGQPDYSATAGTAAELIARGPQQPNVCCTRVAFNQGSKRGWVVLCNMHAAVQRSEEARNLSVPLPMTMRSPLQQPPASVSISARWRQQIKKKKRAKRTSAFARGSTEDD